MDGQRASTSQVAGSNPAGRATGDWCSGSTSASKSEDLGSIPRSPASLISRLSCSRESPAATKPEGGAVRSLRAGGLDESRFVESLLRLGQRHVEAAGQDNHFPHVGHAVSVAGRNIGVKFL